jgi:subtilisin family serine protease
MTDKDDDFDENGLLKNGRSSRVGMMMRDSLSPVQRAVMQDGIERAAADERITIVDAFGNAGAALQRPGARYAVPSPAATDPAPAQDATDPRDEAYRQHDAEEARRWQGDGREVPVKRVTGDARMDAYLDREEHDANAWKQAR